MSKVLIIAEKFSVARDIARVVQANNKVVEGKDARYGYYEGNEYIISWCYGHLVSLCYPEDYDDNLKSWSIKNLPFIPSDWKYTIVSSTKKQYGVLKKLLHNKEIDKVICATDADREGELIFRLVYNESKCNKPVWRLWISSMEDVAIKKGLQNLRPGSDFDNLYHAADARQKADWIIGLNATRYFTTRFSNPKNVLNIGRVQTPTVNLIVQRQLEIDNFKPSPYYVLCADTGSFKAFLKENDAALAAAKANKCNGKPGTIVSIKTEHKKEAPPALYDLTHLQQDANKLYGLSATETLNAAQSLYEKKLLTYPRTDSQYLTSDMENTITTIVHGFISHAKQAFGKSTPNIKHIINDKKVSGHHAIVPTETSIGSSLAGLSVHEQKVFNLVMIRLLIAVCVPYEYLSTSVSLDVSGEIFKAAGQQVLVPGWRAILDTLKTTANTNKSESSESSGDNSEHQALPKLQEGDTFDSVSVSFEEKFTKPPSAYTEATLLRDMQNIGKRIENKELRAIMTHVDDNGNKKMLGTSATQASIIEKIIKVGYVSKKGKQLFPTDKAFALMKILPEEIKSPDMTAEWEYSLEEIKNGKVSEQVFIDGISNLIKKIISVNEIDARNASVDSGDSKAFNVSSIGNCPCCGSEVQEKEKGYCCNNRSCNVVVWKTVAGKSIPAAQAKKLLTNGKTDLIKGFHSKSGKLFNAYLVFNENHEIKFEFDHK